MNFKEWMISAGLSKSSVDKYVGAINGRLSVWAIAHNLTRGSLSEVEDPIMFASLAKMIKETKDYKVWNVTGHHMYGAALKQFEKYLKHMVAATNSDTILAGPLSTQMLAIEAEEMYIPFDPKGLDDGRERVLRDVVQRRGQPKFRNSLIKAYKGRCAITDCSILSILEAAHITPYLGPTTNAVSNGLLLRADIHTLWDLALIAVEPDHQTIWVSPTIGDAEYRALAGKLLCEPSEPRNRPSLIALKEQWNLIEEETE